MLSFSLVPPDHLQKLCFGDVLHRVPVMNDNDTFGRDFGDMVLKEIGVQLGENDHVETVARFGDDQFGAVLRDVASEDDVSAVLSGIVERQKEPLHIKGRKIEISLKFGAAIYPDQARSTLELISKAEAAARMLEENEKPFLIYSQSMDDELRDHQELAHDLEGAVDRQELRLYYQPIIDIKTRRITSCEALIRWQHPERGLLSPDAFIPIAENTGQILQIGEWVLNESCSQLKAWMTSMPLDIKGVAVSINLSARQLYVPDMVDKVIGALERTELGPEFIELEITETMLMKNMDIVQDSLRRLDDLGVKLVIDDFGTGYSSLAYVSEFPVSVCKIDRSFVSQINNDVNKTMVMETIIMLAQKMGMTVTAEGVEDESQLRALAKLNCDSAQGYLFSKPIPSEDFLSLLIRERQDKAA